MFLCDEPAFTEASADKKTKHPFLRRRERVLCFGTALQVYDILLRPKAAIAPFRLEGQQQQQLWANGWFIPFYFANLRQNGYKFQANLDFLPFSE